MIMSVASPCLRLSARPKLSPSCLWTRYETQLSRSLRRLSTIASRSHCTTSPPHALWTSSAVRPGCRHPTTYGAVVGRHVSTQTSKDSSLGATGEFQLVYTGPLKGAVMALKVFSLSTAVLASFGGPVLVWLGKDSVPVAARIAMSTLVLLVSLSTTAILHWLLKGYITHLYYQPHTQRVAALTLSLLAQRVRSEFDAHEMRPPSGLAGFSTFQAGGRGYFMHTEVFPDKQLLSALLDSHKLKSTRSDDIKKD